MKMNKMPENTTLFPKLFVEKYFSEFVECMKCYEIFGKKCSIPKMLLKTLS